MCACITLLSEIVSLTAVAVGMLLGTRELRNKGFVGVVRTYGFLSGAP